MLNHKPQFGLAGITKNLDITTQAINRLNSKQNSTMETLNKFTDLHLVQNNGRIIVRRGDGEFQARLGIIRQSGKQVRFFADSMPLSSKELEEIAKVMDIVKARFWDYVHDNVGTPNN